MLEWRTGREKLLLTLSEGVRESEVERKTLAKELRRNRKEGNSELSVCVNAVAVTVQEVFNMNHHRTRWTD